MRKPGLRVLVQLPLEEHVRVALQHALFAVQVPQRLHCLQAKLKAKGRVAHLAAPPLLRQVGLPDPQCAHELVREPNV